MLKYKKVFIVNYNAYRPSISKFTRHYDLSSHLIKKGYQVNIFGSSFIHDTKTQQDNLETENVDGVIFHKIKNSGFTGNVSRVLSEVKYLYSTIRYIRKFIKNSPSSKPDIIYASSPGLFNGLTGWVLSKIYKAKFIFEVRDIWPDSLVAFNLISNKGIIYKFFKLLEIFLYKTADKLIFTAPLFHEYLRTNGIDETKAVHIGNGVDLQRFDQNKEKYRKSLKFAPDKFNILYTGSIGIINNLDKLIDIAALLKDSNINFHIAGVGSEEEKLKQYVKELNLNNFFFHGFYEKKFIPSILTQADAVIIIINNDNKNIELYKVGTSANKVGEYFASSKPLIYWTNTDVQMITEANAGIIIHTQNKKEIVHNLLEFAQMSQEEKEQLGNNGRKYVENNFAMTILSDKLDRLLQQL